MSPIGRYHIMLTGDEYARLTGRLQGIADIIDVYEKTCGEHLREIVTDLKNRTTYIEEETD